MYLRVVLKILTWIKKATSVLTMQTRVVTVFALQFLLLFIKVPNTCQERICALL